MGIYDRDYYRQGRSGFRLRAPRTAIGLIILLNVAVFVAEEVDLYGFRGVSVANALSTHIPAVNHAPDGSLRLREPGARPEIEPRHDDHPQYDTLRRPWMWWQLLTCGFVHDPIKIEHIFFNMLVLFFLGRDVEELYGTREFIRLYLAAVVFASLVWAAVNHLFPPQPVVNEFGQEISDFTMCGASGAIAGVIVLYALNFPKRILLFMFVIPVPAWLLGALAIAWDVYGAMRRTDSNIAYTAHLGGAAFALAYFNFRWNFSRLWAAAAAWIKGRARPSLKVFEPDDLDGPVSDEEVDRILAKINREGKNSLTRKERRILDNASAEYRRRRQPE